MYKHDQVLLAVTKIHNEEQNHIKQFNQFMVWLNCWHNSNTKTRYSQSIPRCRHHEECWARKALILCSNSFLTLSGTRAKKNKNGIEHNCVINSLNKEKHLWKCCIDLYVWKHVLVSIGCKVQSLPLPLGVTPATKSSTVTFSIPFSLITSEKPNTQCYFTWKEHAILTRAH